MKRLVTGMPLVGVLVLLLFSFSASAGTAVSAKSKPPTLRTLVSEKGPIRSFAQGESTIAWIGGEFRVHVSSLTRSAGAIVGSAGPAVASPRWTPSLALAGSRAVWNTRPSGGNSLESELVTAAPWDPRETAIDLFIDPQEPNGGTFLAGLTGDGPTLVYGKTSENCDDRGGNNCHRLDAAGGVAIVTGQYESALVPGIPPPVMLAFAAHNPQSSNRISQGLIAVAPAETPIVTDLGNVPRAAENGPVEVYRLLYGQTHLASRVTPQGTVRAIALDFHQLAVLVQRHDGAKALERYNPTTGASLGTTVVPSAASNLSIGTAGIVYRVGSKIYLLGAGQPKLVWRASGTPIGLSIEGRRIAWAVNIKGRARIVALTLPR